MKSFKILSVVLAFLLGIAIGTLIFVIKQKNEDIAFLKEEISKVQSDRFKDMLRFGQWKLQGKHSLKYTL